MTLITQHEQELKTQGAYLGHTGSTAQCTSANYYNLDEYIIFISVMIEK